MLFEVQRSTHNKSIENDVFENAVKLCQYIIVMVILHINKHKLLINNQFLTCKVTCAMFVKIHTIIIQLENAAATIKTSDRHHATSRTEQY